MATSVVSILIFLPCRKKNFSAHMILYERVKGRKSWKSIISLAWESIISLAWSQTKYQISSALCVKLLFNLGHYMKWNAEFHFLGCSQTRVSNLFPENSVTLSCFSKQRYWRTKHAYDPDQNQKFPWHLGKSPSHPSGVIHTFFFLSPFLL